MPTQRIRVGDDYYLLASALAPRRPRLFLNHGDSFAIVDLAGDVPLAGREAYGLFHRGTRFLDRFELRLNSDFPVLLSSTASHDGSELVTHLSNADEKRDGEVVLERDTVAVERRKTLVDGALYEQLALRNYGQEPLRLVLELLYDADFADVFELRGVDRARHGERRPAEIEGGRLRLGYGGLDGVVRETEMRFTPDGWRIGPREARLEVELAPGGEATAEVHVVCRVGDAAPARHEYSAALRSIRRERAEWVERFPKLVSSNDGFNDWLDRSLRDVALLRTVTPEGSYPYAGVPWYATVFGRDGIVTALEALAFAPELAAGTLRTLASLQGREADPERDEEPGKIVHELRYGEMAATGEVPFRRYYGSVDSTPLFLILLAEYVSRTADLELAGELWPAGLAAMEWIDRSGDRDGDGYVEYERRTGRGLVNQGWKDSHDAVFHADGSLAAPPIALAEVQAYVYAARCGLASVARRLDRAVEAATWEAKAALLRDQFHRDFWMSEHDTFALALDREKAPCRVVTSNAGHCLFGGIAEADAGPRVAERLLRNDLFCGWGVRTLSSKERRFNPMSYHNGSVWPHDNALVAAGFARYGATDRAGALLSALFDASLAIEGHRLPELFCGFPRVPGERPVPYPVACSPQAWAAASVFLLLQSALGLTIDAFARRVTFCRTSLPPWLERLHVRGLRVRDSSLDLVVSRGQWGAAVEVVDKQGDVEVVVLK